MALTEEDRPQPRPEGYVYKPAELTLGDLQLNRIHLRTNEFGRTEVYVMANYFNQRDVKIYEDSPHTKAGKWWCYLADAVCHWLNLPAEVREKECHRLGPQRVSDVLRACER